jgi:isopentenyl diphosphate isomerase/L-lactate dehydrogenase-like FMN-dependent dehydrogenase
MVASTMSNQSLEEVATAATCPLWFQLYVYRDRQVTEQLVRRAEAAGYRALVLTVDTARLGRRERDIRNGFGLPPHLHMGNFEGVAREQPGQEPGLSGLAVYANALLDSSLTWEALDWLRSITTLPIVVKGILTAEDAKLAVEHGASGIIVSNHGGRQLDSGMATIEALPEVVAAAHGGTEVYLDGGIAGERMPSRRSRSAREQCCWADRSSGGWQLAGHRASHVFWRCSTPNWNWRWRSWAVPRWPGSARNCCACRSSG